MHGRFSLATLAAALLFAAPAAAEIPAGNLVVNPGAEAAAGATDSSTRSCRSRAGRSSRRSPRSRTARPSSSRSRTPQRLDGGANFFAGGPGGEVASASQTIDVSRAAAEIDAGGPRVLLGADRRVLEPGGLGDGLRHAAELLELRHRPGDDPRPGEARPSAPSTTNLLRRATTFARPRRHAQAQRRHHRDPGVRQLQRRLRRQRQPLLRRRAGRGQERRRVRGQRHSARQARRAARSSSRSIRR